MHISKTSSVLLNITQLVLLFCNKMEAKMKVLLMPIDQEWCSLFIDIFSEEFVAHGASVNCVSLGHKSGRVLVTGGDDKKVNLWAVGKPNCIMVRQKPPIIHPSSFNTTTAYQRSTCPQSKRTITLDQNFFRFSFIPRCKKGHKWICLKHWKLFRKSFTIQRLGLSDLWIAVLLPSLHIHTSSYRLLEVTIFEW